MALPLAGMLLAMLIELALLARTRRLETAGATTDPWLEAVANLNSGHLLLWFFRGLEVAAYGWIARASAPHALSDAPPWLLLPLAFIAWDFGFYWLHRLHHRIPLLWAIHAVHHQGEHFNLSLGIRNSWLSSLSSLPFFVPLALLGVPVELFVIVSTLHYTVQLGNHSALTPPLGPLERVLVTPTHHRIHHGSNPEYIDRNFGGTLIVWDKLFGTFRQAQPGVAIRYGCSGWRRSYSPWLLNLQPLLAAWRRVRNGGAPPAPAPRAWIVAGAVACFVTVIYAVHTQDRWPAGQQPMLWTLLVLHTLALGAWADGWRHAAAATAVAGLGVPLVFIGGFGLRDPLGAIPMLLLGAHGLAALLACAPRAVLR